MPVAYIDDTPFPIEPGESLLAFLERHRGRGSVPTLCHDPNLAPFGSCRVCSVEVAADLGGPRRVVASCHTPVRENLRIYPESPTIQRLRRNIIELVLTDHPLDCLTCEVNGNCQLQSVAARVGVRAVRYPAGETHLNRPKDLSHPYLTSDLAKCINCYRCVRACDEIQGQFVLSMHGRGFNNRIIKGLDADFAGSDCVSCGACAQTCPTAAISDVFRSKSLEATRRVRTVCTYCGVGCNLDVAARGIDVLSIRAPADAAVNHGHTCVKGRYAFGFYRHGDRLRTPLIRRDGKLAPATWDEAYNHIAGRLNAIRDQYGPDAIAGISSARCTNEENYLMQKFLRVVIGTNNIDGCARVCHAPTAWGMQQSFGTGAATNSIADLDRTDLILLIGANPTEGHPVTGAKIKQRAMKGIPLIVIDPRKIELVRYAKHHLQLRPGTNLAVLNMMAYFILEAGLVKHSFVDARCEGFDMYAAQLRALDIPALAAVCGVPAEQVRAAALDYARAPGAMSFHGLGVTEHTQGSKTVMAIANLALLTGNIGRTGVGVNPLRGQNNVQGSADMGVQPHQGAGYLDVTVAENQAYYAKAYGRPVPGNVGYKIPEMFEAARQRALKALWIIGEDVAQTDPNCEEVKAALRSLEFLVVQELFMTETAAFAEVVLPAASFLEKNGTFTNGERRIQRVNRVIEPVAGTRPDGQILVEIMNRMGYPQPTYDAAKLLEEIAAVVPFFRGVRWESLGENGKQWPVAADGADTQILHLESFKGGRGRLIFHPWTESPELVEHRREFPFILTTGRILAHYNAGTMTRRTPNRDLVPADLLAIHPDDAARKGVQDGDRVRLFSDRGEVHLQAVVSREVKPGILYTTFHFPEHLVNRITSDAVDAESRCPEYKVTAVDLEKVAVP
ncbi:MAG TPA: formate dehydrogenase subunit alpha [Planctomycetota bacterium]|nr:formate dehydrogenase subunit alpha [Planctomycetota bacterium]